MPMRSVSGDLFENEYQAQALAHGCNCQGSMGAGIGVGFRQRYPTMYEKYRRRCKTVPRAFNPGDVFLWKADGQPWVFNLATQENDRSYDAMELHEILDQVHDRESFFTFVRALIADREGSVVRERENPSSPYGPDAGGWENTTIESFLEAALAWAEATSMGVTQGLPEEPSWQAFAVFLYLGKIYE